jgi:hypothetical protein
MPGNRPKAAQAGIGLKAQRIPLTRTSEPINPIKEDPTTDGLINIRTIGRPGI